MERIRDKKTLSDLVKIIGFTIFLTFLVWLPHLFSLQNFYGLNFSNGFNTIYRNFDGIEYIIIAKSFYQPELISKLPQSQETFYYPSHFPAFSIFIALLAPVLGYLKSMLFVSLIFTILSTIAFYFLVKDFKLSSHPLWLSILFLVLPARWLIVHSVGSAEPVFIFFVLSSIYFFMKYFESKNFKYVWITALFATLTQLTRPPGILLFISLMLFPFFEYIKEKKFLQAVYTPLKFYPLFLAPLSLIGLFLYFQITLGDFWAYFHTGDNIHLTPPPFQVFNKFQYWVGDIWLEDIIYIFLLGFAGGITLLKSNLKMAGIFVLVYLTATSFVVHRDIARYSLPIFPFLLIAFEKFLNSKEFKIAFAIIFLAIYLYSQNFILENTAPFPNLEFFN